mmetsp:Transcript_10032/g.13044  ORF Transcript_10032/g.13044 Transcript_10032/m.13044 type:complete len:136 (+) Transcript_10032:45-452(+)
MLSFEAKKTLSYVLSICRMNIIFEKHFIVINKYQLLVENHNEEDRRVNLGIDQLSQCSSILFCQTFHTVFTVLSGDLFVQHSRITGKANSAQNKNSEEELLDTTCTTTVAAATTGTRCLSTNANLPTFIISSTRQ